MTINIRDVLHRRSDLSTFIVHLTRDYGRAALRNAFFLEPARDLGAAFSAAVAFVTAETFRLMVT